MRVLGPMSSCTPRRPALAGRRDVVPLPAELVVGHDDHRVLGAAAALDRLSSSTRWPLPSLHVRVAGVLVLGADGLDEAHRLERAVLLRALAPAPRTRPRRAGAPRARGRAGREGGEVVQRLVVELEELVRAVGSRRRRRSARLGVRAASGRRCRSSSPGASTSPSAFDQPPEYHAQSTPLALRRSPIVGAVCGGSLRASAVPGGNGWYGGWIVLTAKSPQVTLAGVAGGSRAAARRRQRAVDESGRQRRVVERRGVVDRGSSVYVGGRHAVGVDHGVQVVGAAVVDRAGPRRRRRRDRATGG